MSENNHIDFRRSLTDTSGTFNIRTQNKDFATEDLSEEEAELFEEQFNILINDFDSKVVSQLFAARKENIADALGLAKNQFDERLFGGINAADNEIGFDVLRPGHIRADPDTGDAVNDWQYSVDDTETGWNDWIGDGSAEMDYSIDEDQVVVVLGFIDQASDTEVSGININRFGRNVDMLPKDLNDARLQDNDNDLMVQALPTLVGTERDRVHARLRSDAAHDSQPRLVGFTFGVGDYMNTEDY